MTRGQVEDLASRLWAFRAGADRLRALRRPGNATKLGLEGHVTTRFYYTKSLLGIFSCLKSASFMKIESAYTSGMQSDL